MRPLLAFALASLVAAQTAKAPQTAAPADRWVKFRGNATLTGVSAAPVRQNLKLLWTYEAGESVESSAAIAGGTVFVGAASGQLAALDLKTGAVRWKYQLDRDWGSGSADEPLVEPRRGADRQAGCRGANHCIDELVGIVCAPRASCRFRRPKP